MSEIMRRSASGDPQQFWQLELSSNHSASTFVCEGCSIPIEEEELHLFQPILGAV